MSTTTFPGFYDPEANYSRMPHQLIGLLPDLKEAELKIVLYLIRHTWGYHDAEKPITIDEFCNGRRRSDGSRIDGGTGLSENGVRKGLEGAIKKGIVVNSRTDDSDKARIKKYYSLATAESSTPHNVNPGVQNLHPYLQNLHPWGAKFAPRSEKETLETNLEKETLERTDSPPAQEFPELSILGNSENDKIEAKPRYTNGAGGDLENLIVQVLSRWEQLFPRQPKTRPNNKLLVSNLRYWLERARREEREYFLENWERAMIIASENHRLATSSWFNLAWVLGKGKPGKEAGHVRLCNREFDWMLGSNGRAPHPDAPDPMAGRGIEGMQALKPIEPGSMFY